MRYLLIALLLSITGCAGNYTFNPGYANILMEGNRDFERQLNDTINAKFQGQPYRTHCVTQPDYLGRGHTTDCTGGH
jgi:hypothetical protein